MEEAKRKLEMTLKGSGYSLTRPRLAVLEYMLGREPVSVAVLTKALSSQIDRASVYRTITLFQILGIIQRHTVGLKYRIELTDMFAEHHHHFTCITCGAVTSMSEQALERFVDKLAEHYGFIPTEHQIEVQGYCKNCKQTQTT
ncbi:MAG: transcriptional regulator, Fur family transcriptional regulator, ferric uptake regulator [Candidatus Saccharibacteria bacterium]|nr:transcriptional regulator, Fur family transcriptional regulator, ferric uptake regulator [Candidatus Saccharibacteria bacterium]